jgi:hypothetical protein
MPAIRPKPLPPLATERLRRDPLPFIRAATAFLLAFHQHARPEEIVRQYWPNDTDTMMVTRAASTPATIAGSGATFAGAMVADFISVLAPQWAGAALLAHGLGFELGQGASIKVPGSLVAATNANFLLEGDQIRVNADSLDGPVIGPKKLGAIGVWTNEQFAASIPNIQKYVQTELVSSIGLAFDAALLDVNAATATRPAGIRAGISALTASGASTPDAARLADLKSLVGSVAAVAGQSEIVLVAHPAQAVALKLAPTMPYLVLSSSSLATGVVIAVATNCLISALDPVPDFYATDQATLHMDSVPLPINGGTFAAPVRSLWSTDCVALRVILGVNWALRSQSAVAWLTATGW